MDQKDLIKACLDLAAFSADRFDARRDYQWKITLGIWSLLAAGAAFSYGKPFALPWLFIPSVTLLHSIWIRGVYVGNYNDRTKAYHFREQAEQCLIDKNQKVLRSPAMIKRWRWRWWIGFLANWANLFEVIATATLATAACVISHLGQTFPSSLKPN